ncbi:hypothetical protein OG777_31105 [Micromonospora peucetia]|uniref:hypothetical protein n=1 Tax=Micromonospora peucetia TaxID=47871 RepID=UPI0022554276|nr:hypothetical protein [Micromonospora peucetia]MCX4391355.1 hypothetical protein [Micromonospora peucetia]
MTMWLLILLIVVVVVAALMWRTERSNRRIHGPGSGSHDMAARAERARTHDESMDASG